MYPFYFDATMIVVIPAIILVIWAQFKVKSTFSRYQEVNSQMGYTGAQVAVDILHRAGLGHVRVERIAGDLTDHYDPRQQVLRLSDPVYAGRSIAALGVAAHETGHAMQHAENYTPLGIRNSIVPVANFGSQLGLPLALFGFFFFRSPSIILIGVLMYLAAVIFQMITLPVEFNASSRAMAILESGGYLNRNELGAARKVLDAAAWTYVAAALMALAQLARLLLMFAGARNNDDR